MTFGKPLRKEGEELEVELLTNDQWLNRSCLCDEASTELLKMQGVSESPGWWTHGGTGRVARPQRPWKLVPLPSYLALCIPSIRLLLSCIFSPVSKLSWVLRTVLTHYGTPKRGLREPLIYSQLVRRTGEKWACIWYLQCGEGAVLWDSPFNQRVLC